MIFGIRIGFVEFANSTSCIVLIVIITRLIIVLASSNFERALLTILVVFSTVILPIAISVLGIIQFIAAGAILPVVAISVLPAGAIVTVKPLVMLVATGFARIPVTIIIPVIL